MNDPILSPTSRASDAKAVESPTCSLCAVILPTGVAAQSVNGADVCEACALQIQRELAAEKGSISDYPLAIVLGVAAAVVSGAIWAAIVVITDYEVGYVAVGVGYLTGLAVKFGAGSARNQTLQIAAAALSVLGLVIAKYFTLAHFLIRAVEAEGGEAPGYFSLELMLAFPQYLVQMVSPFDALWVAFAVVTAYKVPAPTRISLENAAS